MQSATVDSSQKDTNNKNYIAVVGNHALFLVSGIFEYIRDLVSSIFTDIARTRGPRPAPNPQRSQVRPLWIWRWARAPRPCDICEDKRNQISDLFKNSADRVQRPMIHAACSTLTRKRKRAGRNTRQLQHKKVDNPVGKPLDHCWATTDI